VFNCSDCNQVLTKAGFLVVRLKKTTNLLHEALKHDGEWDTCTLEPCVINFRVIRGEIRDVGE
jgi:hypothetical protein